MKTKIEDLHTLKIGKLFDVTLIGENTFTIKTNPVIANLVGANDPKKFESYLRKSFRNFYNLDKSLQVNQSGERLEINTPQE